MAHKALLVMDVQPGILENLGTAAEAYLQKVRRAVEAAHTAKMPVIFVVVRFRKGFPEVSPNNKSFSTIKNRTDNKLFESESSAQPAIKPGKNDIVVTKRRVSAFSGSDLEVILRAQTIDSLVLCGIATSGVVLSTLREAADKDYQLTVIADACFDGDEEIHKVLLAKIFPRQADVISVDDWVNGQQK